MIDLFSDTKTKPTPTMRRAMAEAEVGDDHLGEDPTVNALIETGCRLLGKEAALFLPSATMANQIAIRTATRPGDEILCHEHCHIRLYESGGPALFSGCLLAPLAGPRGLFTPEQIRAALRPAGPYFPPTRLVCVENTHNYAGGTVWRKDELAAVAQTARTLGLGIHLDGSRLFNAAVKLDVPASDLAAPFDTVTLCLSKGLGAPAGALLLGSADFCRAARRWKHAFGGAMRQSGILAAGGLHALIHHIDRLADDHANAQKLAAGLADLPGVRLDPWPETNLVFVDIAGTGLTADDARARLKAEGVLASGLGPYRLRFATHLDIAGDDIDRALAAIRRALPTKPS